MIETRFKAITGKLYPNKTQAIYFNKNFGCSRFIYNEMLSNKESSYLLKGKTCNKTVAEIKKEHEWLKEVDSMGLSNARLDLKTAYDNFFKGLAEAPRFKAKYRSSFAYKTDNQFPRETNKLKSETIQVVKNKLTAEEVKEHNEEVIKTNNENKKQYYAKQREDIKNGVISKKERKKYKSPILDIWSSKDKVKLPKIGWVLAHLSRGIPDGYKIISATIKKLSCGDYTISILCEYQIDIPIENEIKMTDKNTKGIDFKMDTLYRTSDGEDANYPKYYRNAELKLKKEQRKLSKMQFKSNNYEKQRIKVATLHNKIKNQRKDFLNKKSSELVKTTQYIWVEDLNLKTMSKTLHFGKSVHDVGFGMFRNMLSYKLELKGGKLLKASKHFASTQICSKCGYKNTDIKGKENLKVREWECPKCHTLHDRDTNAAINLKQFGLNLYHEHNDTFNFLEVKEKTETMKSKIKSGRNKKSKKTTDNKVIDKQTY